MHAIIVKAGLLSTIQDQGRTGYRNSGIPVSGVMDPMAPLIANLLVGNNSNAPVLELTYGAVEMLAGSDLLICYAGGGATMFANDQQLPAWKTLFIPAGTFLKFNSNNRGCRTYVSIAGGWCAEKTLNSYSTYLPLQIGGVNGNLLTAGAHLHSEEDLSATSMAMLRHLGSAFINYPNWSVSVGSFVNYTSKKIRVIVNHEFNWFDLDAQKALFEDFFSLTMQCDRMGYQLEGSPLNLKHPRQLLSTAVSKGTIQVTSSGTMILLMSDCQTTGGYPRIAQVAAVDLPVCAQLKPGDTLQFERISLKDAERQLLLQLNKFSALEQHIQARFS